MGQLREAIQMRILGWMTREPGEDGEFVILIGCNSVPAGGPTDIFGGRVDPAVLGSIR